MTIKTNQFTALKTQFEINLVASGMTFNPSIDCRNDLVNFYGYTRKEVNAMSDGEVFSIMDKKEDEDKGYFEHENVLPEPIQDTKCACGGYLKVVYIDCETRGDCEIYNCECVTCENPVNINYAQEWFVYSPEDQIGDLINDIDNACYNRHFNKAIEIVKTTKEEISKIEGDDTYLTTALEEKIAYLSKRHNISFVAVTKDNENDMRSLCDVKELSVRSYNCLKRAGYDTVQQVKDSSLDDMYKVRNLGRLSLEEIQTLFNFTFK
jgi:hypothetical protein